MQGWMSFTGGLAAGAGLGLLVASARANSHRSDGTPAPTYGTDTSNGSLEASVARLGQRERRVLVRMLHRAPVARDVNAAFEEQLSLGQRLADRIATFGGSWTFIGLFAAFLVAWMTYNDRAGSMDPFPFILLNLMLSCLAAVQAPLILMSQNRMAAKDRSDARHDYEVNLKAEMEIIGLHAKLDDLLGQIVSKLPQP